MDRKKSFKKFPEIKTLRLILREPTMADADWYLEHFSRPEVVKGQGFPAPKGMKAARKELKRYMIDLYKEREGFCWLIALKGENRPIGFIGYYKWLPSADYQAEMGYSLEKKYWGKGLMTEGMKAALDFAFRRMKLNRIEIFIMPRNRRSIRLVKRLGFRKEGVFRQRSFDELGKFTDDALFSMLKSDWKKRRRAE